MTASIVLITGALTGIGRATALAFAQEGARMSSGAGAPRPAVRFVDDEVPVALHDQCVVAVARGQRLVRGQLLVGGQLTAARGAARATGRS